MDGLRGHYAKWNKIRQGKKNTVWYHFYVKSKKYNRLVNKKNRLTDTENKLVVTSEKREGGRGKIQAEGKQKQLLQDCMKSFIRNFWKL